jgi:hypothetical protein
MEIMLHIKNIKIGMYSIRIRIKIIMKDKSNREIKLKRQKIMGTMWRTMEIIII